MNYRQLEVFRALMDCGSATAAASRLGISQPSVSRQLAQIERELGLDLFARSAGKLRATANAIALYDEVTFAFAGIDRVLNLASRLRGHDTGVLRIASPHALGEVFLPRVIARLAASHRNLRYAVEFGTYETIASMVAKRAVDIGVLKEPVPHEGISAQPLVDTGTVCLLPQGHALAKHSEITVAALADQPLVLLGRDTVWRSELNTLFRAARRLPNIRLDTHSATAICGFVANGLGVSVLPELLAAQFAGRGIVLKPLATRIEHRFAIALPSGLQRAGLAAEFVLEGRAVAEQLLAQARAPARRPRQRASKP
ncbi:LysR substrate-binding domain-containing protein [Ideonella sp. BN130291]|uniref:LysR substrate-binding domain-containing protein n=1 Tax=Ideonella sp. BN130291 TaxID=3112940 RepID=UPI002E260D65|nr:LysR substrate-binding domain-containing protein [Ideonella sp. BN130291]